MLCLLLRVCRGLVDVADVWGFYGCVIVCGYELRKKASKDLIRVHDMSLVF